MRHAVRRTGESAIFCEFEPALAAGGGAAQHLARLIGRSRALEVILSADDYDAELAERYGWINRALPHDALGKFVRSLAHRIANFPPAGRTSVKNRVSAIALTSKDDFRRDSDLFGEGGGNPEAEKQIQGALKAGFQTREAELNLGPAVGGLGWRLILKMRKETRENGRVHLS